MKEIKYEYAIFVWGGFFNAHNKEKHGIEPGLSYFNNKEDRKEFTDLIEEWKIILKDEYGSSDAVCMSQKFEGPNIEIRNLPVLNRVVEYKGKLYHLQDKWSWIVKYSTLAYHNKYKWYPGFNAYIDEQVGEKVDYSKVKEISQWVSGSVKLEYDQ